MTEAKASIRLATTGADQARADITSLGDAGDKAAQRLQAAMARAGADADSATRRYQASAEKLAAITPQTPVQMRVNDTVSSGFGQYEGSAKSAAVALAGLLAQEEALDARGQALRATIDPLSVAQERFNTAMANADELLLAGRISLDQYVASEAAAATQLGAVTAAIEKQGAAAKLASLMPRTGMQAQIDDSVGTGFGEIEGSAQRSASAMGPLLAAEEQLTARTQALLAAIDPVAAAQMRANAQVADARELFAQGAISAEQLAKAEAIAENAANGLAHGHQGASVSSMILEHSVRSATDSLAAGLPVSMIVGEQMARLAEAASFAGGKFKAVGEFMSGPWGIAIMVGVSVLGMLGTKLLEDADAADEMKKHQQDLGSIIDQTTGKINEQSKALLLNQAVLSQHDAKQAAKDADSAKRSILGQADPIAAVSGAGFGGDETVTQDPRIAAAIRAFGKDGNADNLAKSLQAIGAQSPKLKATTDQILAQGAAYVTASRQAEQYQAQTRLLTGTAQPGDQRKAIGQFGPEKPDLALVDAEAKLAAATTKREKAEAQATITRIQATKAFNDGTITIDNYRQQMTKADAAVDAASQHTDKHAQALARDAASMTVNAQASLDVATAYLQSGAAGQQAEAARKALTDATKKGIDTDAQVRRQLGVSIADGVATGAKSISQLREETAARTSANLEVTNGTIRVSQMGQALSDEAALRDLTTKQLLAQKLGMTTYYEAITTVIDAYKGALAEAHAEETHGQALQSLDALSNRISDARLASRFAGDTSGDADRAKALTSADREAATWSPDDRATHDVSAVLATNTELDAKRKQSAADALRAENDNLAVTQAQLGMVGKSADAQQLVVDQLKLQQQLAVGLGDQYATYAPAQLAAAAASDVAAIHLKNVQSTMSELRSEGDKIVDDLFNPNGDKLKSILSDVREEMEKMALINPLKNLLLGENNPTLGSLFGGSGGAGGIGKVFSGLKGLLGLGGGGGSGIGASIGGSFAPDQLAVTPIDLTSSLFHFASGTDYAPGGAAIVGENGPEEINLPRGSGVMNAADTRRMMSASNDAGPSTVHNHFSGNLLTPEWWSQIQAGNDHASMRGATGGAQLAAKKSARQARQRLGTRG